MFAFRFGLLPVNFCQNLNSPQRYGPTLNCARPGFFTKEEIEQILSIGQNFYSRFCVKFWDFCFENQFDLAYIGIWDEHI